jgi:hypothetical protein
LLVQLAFSRLAPRRHVEQFGVGKPKCQSTLVKLGRVSELTLVDVAHAGDRLRRDRSVTRVGDAELFASVLVGVPEGGSAARIRCGSSRSNLASVGRLHHGIEPDYREIETPQSSKGRYASGSQ